MNWYLAKIVFEIICGNGQHMAQFDEQLRIIQATGPTEALQKAIDTGVREQDTFMNDNRKIVQWKFLNVCDLYRLSDIADGAEVCSRVHEHENASNYRQLINHKAAMLHQELSQHSLQLY